MKILLFGHNGQVGWELQRSLAPLGELITPDRNDDGELHGDLGVPEKLVETVRTVGPDIIVNAAAYTKVDQAESEPELAARINAEAPAVLAREAGRTNAWFIHYSSDYVFDGSGESPWKETDNTAPVNAYGASKLEGELGVQAGGCRYLIFRTSWVYAARRNNFLRTILRLVQERDTLQVINDQAGAPTGAELIADVTAQALARLTGGAGDVGLYHLAARGETTWYDYARFILEWARRAGLEPRLADEGLVPVTSSHFQSQAPRPGNSRLDCSRLEQNFDLRLPEWQSGVDRVLTELLEPVSEMGAGTL